MKRALAILVLAACSRPVERPAPPPSVVAVADAAVDVPADAMPADAAMRDAPTSVMATVSRVDVVGADTLIVLAAGSDDGVQPGWRVMFIVDRDVPPCPIVRVSRHETVCKWNQTFLPSRVVRLEP
jgi:hypothetical protein